MPDGMKSPEQSGSSFEYMRNLGKIGPHMEGASESVKAVTNPVDMATGAPKTSEDALRDQIERQLSYERAVEAGLERVGSTTLPWEVRMAIRDVEFDFADAPVGLGDNWGYQRLYSGLEDRRRSLQTLNAGDSVSRAVGFAAEPWRKASLITRQNKLELKSYLLDSGISDEKVIDGKIESLEGEAKERLPILCKELGERRDELSLVRKIYFLGWNMRGAASGNEVGEIYLQSKMPSIPRPKDFAHMFSAPSYFMTEAEVNNAPGYPAAEDRKSLLTELGRNPENLPLGETIEKEVRLLYLVALSERPELVMKWKNKTEQEALFEKYRAVGVSEAYLVLKDKGIDYRDPDEEAKIERVLNALDGIQEREITNSWWKSLGFKDEADGISQIGDPEKWIPREARRGRPPAGAEEYFSPTFRREDLKNQISRELETLKGLWREMSPLNNPTEAQKETIRGKIDKCTDSLREKQTIDVLIPGKDPKLISLFYTLALEREMGLRKGATELGSVWSQIQTAEEKEKKENDLAAFTSGDKLAYETAKIISDMFGFQAKHGIYAVDYDPRNKDKETRGWGTVSAEAWPYTNEFQNILAYPWYALYKAEAGGPPGSRGRFGPPMTDYLSSCVTKEFDENGNELFIIVDATKQIRKGRADEGLVIADTSSTLLDVWEKGKSLSDPNLWNNTDEDPFRRFLLRGFFAEGKAAIRSDGMIDMWKKREWDFKELDDDKFWDAYKLNRKVTVRDELFDEEIWKDVLKTHNEDYMKKAGEVLTEVKASTDPVGVMKKNAEMFDSWKGGRKKIIYNYCDQTFWRGVASTAAIGNMAASEEGLFEKGRQESPQELVKRIIRRAKSCTVNLVGSYNTDIDKLMKG